MKRSKVADGGTGKRAAEAEDRFERLDRLVRDLITRFQALRTEHAALQERLAERDEQIRDLNQRRQDAGKRLDDVLARLDQLDARMEGPADGAPDEASG